MAIIGASLVVSLALLHVFADRFVWLDLLPRRSWISLAGGISIAYIFLDILPELSHAQAEVTHSEVVLLDYLENHIYLVALVGLVAFYGLEQLALRSRLRNKNEHGRDFTRIGIFWVHIVSFALYNALLGYLLRESENHGLLACVLLFLVLALHFIVNDRGLRTHHKHLYDQWGRWILTASIIAGWSIGQAVMVNEVAIATLWAFVAGGIILNVLKEELPDHQESSFQSFAVGAGVYGAILLWV